MCLKTFPSLFWGSSSCWRNDWGKGICHFHGLQVGFRVGIHKTIYHQTHLNYPNLVYNFRIPAQNNLISQFKSWLQAAIYSSNLKTAFVKMSSAESKNSSTSFKDLESQLKSKEIILFSVKNEDASPVIRNEMISNLWLILFSKNWWFLNLVRH